MNECGVVVVYVLCNPVDCNTLDLIPSGKTHSDVIISAHSNERIKGFLKKLLSTCKP
jgi:hypothetical protein